MKRALGNAVLRWFNDVAEHGIVTTDTALRIQSWNRWLELHTGLGAHATVGRPLMEAVPDLERRGFAPYYAAALRGEVSVISQALHGHLIGMRGRAGNHAMSEMPQTARIGPLTDDDRVVGTITVIEDVSERTLREADLRRRIDELDTARREAEAAVRAKDQFLATLSHELRTPLTAVMGWTRILRTKAADESQTTRALEIIERNAVSQVRLIDDLLDMSRILTGKLRIDIRPLDLVAVVAAAVDISAPSALAKGVDLRVRMMPRLPFVGDSERLRQIVWNIVSNAVKFTPQGGTIDVEVIVDGGAAVIRVRDTGDGIEAAFLPYVFQRFRQADSSTSRQHGGLGIGLSLVRELVELHGGSVRAESDGPGHGTTLSVRLPLVAGLLEGTAAGNGATRDVGAPLAGLAVLVVDDEVDTREMLRAMLTAEGAEVAAAGGTDDAFAALLDHPACVIITDLAMPGEDGYALLARLRDDVRFKSTPAIALTAYTSSEERARALAEGFAAYHVKPVEIEALTATILSVASRANPSG